MVALLDQVWEVVDAACKAVPVRVLCGVMVVVVMMMVGAGGVMDEARQRAGTRGEAREWAGRLSLGRARALTLSVVTCALSDDQCAVFAGCRARIALAFIMNDHSLHRLRLSVTQPGRHSSGVLRAGG